MRMSFSTPRTSRVTVLVAAVLLCGSLAAEDWPTWRHDAQRSGFTSEQLSDDLHVQWVCELPPLEPAWPDQDRLRFDVAYQPVVKGDTLYFSSPRSDYVMALSASTGEMKWRFFTNGPVRFAPLVWKDKLFVASDDGYLYCVNAADGTLAWKFHGAPMHRLLIGNKRMISMWAVRGAPVIVDGTVYFGSGIWPFMGIFLYGLDADSGKEVWHNDSTAHIFIDQPHRSPAFAGLAPQGYLAASGDTLLVPNGRAGPALLDRVTGKLLHFRHADSGSTGGYSVLLGGKYYFNGGRLTELATGQGGWRQRNYILNPVMNRDRMYATVYERIDKDTVKISVHALKYMMKNKVDRKGNPIVVPGVVSLWTLDESLKLHIRAGRTLYASEADTLVAVRLPRPENAPRIIWKKKVGGRPETVIAANGRLYVSTLEGRLICYGPEKVLAPLRRMIPTEVERAPDPVGFPTSVGVTEGYCLVVGLTDGHMLKEIARNSELRVIAVEADAGRVRRIRESLLDDGLYGKRVSIIVGDPATVKLPPYFASLIAFEAPFAGDDALILKLYECLRPYGGVVRFRQSLKSVALLESAMKNSKLSRARVSLVDDYFLLERSGSLPGAGSWTHQYGDPSNSVVSKDRLVRLPLGMLWFGGSTHYDTLPRHGHGPTEQVLDGRLIIEGPDTLQAMDVYTGRLLWKRHIPDIGRAYDNVLHQPGANSIGSNYATTHDGIYVILGERIIRLDPVSGETIQTISADAAMAAMAKSARLPATEDTASQFSFIAIHGNFLITAVSPLTFDWDPEFTRGQFWRFQREKREGELLELISSWKRGSYFPAPRRLRGKVAIAYVVKNFNEILNEESLRSQIPEDVLREYADDEKARAIQDEIDNYLKTGNRPPKYDTPLRALNRQLLSIFFPVVPGKLRGEPGYFNQDQTSSRSIVVLDRKSGKPIWRKKAVHAFRHNTICVGNDILYCIDRVPNTEYSILKRRGLEPEKPATLYAFDLRTGRELWSTHDDVFGTWLGYSREYDILIESGRPSRDMLSDEPRERMRAYGASSGRVGWESDRPYTGPVMLYHDRILHQMGARSLLTGKAAKRPCYLTGGEFDWDFRRMYGCNSPVASEHLLTFRSAAAGYYDLARDGGTGNFGGFKSGCTANLIAADGVLNAPDYTRTCVCSYQNQTSLALVHMPEVETWTFNIRRLGGKRYTKLGLNLGAPGDRLADDDTMWLEFPVTGGPSPPLDVTILPDDVTRFIDHSARITPAEKNWVAASGIKGIREITIYLGPPPALAPLARLGPVWSRHTVRLYFSEPDNVKPGDRVFDVAIFGKTMLKNFDVVRSAGGRWRTVVREFRGIRVGRRLRITLTPSEAGRLREPLLCGIEIVKEEESE